jgi:poly(A) polymerase
MKTVISGVEVDLLFARVNLPEAGDKLDIEKDEILRGVDDASQRSLNGELIGSQSSCKDWAASVWASS